MPLSIEQPEPGAAPRFRMPPSVRLWLPVVLSFVVQGIGTLGILAWTRQPLDLSWLAALAIAVAGPLALIAARRLPGPVALATVAAAVADLVIAPAPQPLPLAMIFGVSFAIVRGRRIWAYASLVVGWSAALLLGSFGQLDWHPGRVVGTTLALVFLVAVSEGIRLRRERGIERRRLAHERRVSAEQEERVRIARELHDVIAHSLSQISVQAGVGLHLMDSQPEQAREALTNIRATSTSALDEVRDVLGLLRGDDAPLTPGPGLEQLPRLAASVTGLHVDLRAGELGDVPHPVQQAVYRIVQESLTNAVRHARAGHAVVELDRLDDELVVTVRDDGDSGAVIRPGNGILGMTERAEQLGGHLTVNSEPRGVRVTARLPIARRTAS